MDMYVNVDVNECERGLAGSAARAIAVITPPFACSRDATRTQGTVEKVKTSGCAAGRPSENPSLSDLPVLLSLDTAAYTNTDPVCGRPLIVDQKFPALLGRFTASQAGPYLARDLSVCALCVFEMLYGT